MKIIFLNAWHERRKKELEEFVKNQVSDTDIFCFQDISPGILGNTLPNHKEIAVQKEIGKNAIMFLSIYVRNVKPFSSQILLEDLKDAGVVSCVELSGGKEKLFIANFYGASFPGEKLDTPIRLEQSRAVIDFLKEKKGLKIIGGDFNILPDQKSIRKFEESGYRDLIKDFKIPTTRNRLAWEKHPTKLYYSDYIFISQEVKVKSFSVPNLEISDHLPLILEVEF